jgi:hypothetical protein
MKKEDVDKLVGDLAESFDPSDWESLSGTCEMFGAVSSIIVEQRRLRRKKGKGADLESLLKFLSDQNKDTTLVTAAESVSFIEAVAEGNSYFGVTVPPSENELEEAQKKLTDLIPVVKRLLEEGNEAG